MDAKVEVLEVVPLAAGDGPVRESAIDRPAVGQEGSGVRHDWSLDVRGWALGSAEPVEEVEISTGVRVFRVPCGVARPDVAAERPDLAGAGASGYYATVGALDLPARFELRLEACLAGGARSPLGLIRGRRAALVTSFEPRLRPLMVTGPGRAGSTIFMQMLAGHAEVAVHPPFDEEPRVATYWLDVLRTLARPESWMRQVSPAGPLNDGWWLGAATPAPRRLRSRSLQAWLAGEAVEDIAAFAQSRIEAVYARIASETGKPGAGYFAEKLRNDVVSDLLWELYPSAREVVLVRDPRDVLASVLAATRKRGAQPPPADPRRWVGEEFTTRILTVLESWRRRGERAHLVRYEDLMMEPHETLSRVVEYLGTGGAAAVEAMIASAGRRLPGMDEHRTTADAASSIGRWRRDLPAGLAQECDRAVAPALAAWGYADEPSPSARAPAGKPHTPAR